MEPNTEAVAGLRALTESFPDTLVALVAFEREVDAERATLGLSADEAEMIKAVVRGKWAALYAEPHMPMLTVHERAVFHSGRGASLRKHFYATDPATWTATAIRVVNELVSEGCRSDRSTLFVEGILQEVIDLQERQRAERRGH